MSVGHVVALTLVGLGAAAICLSGLGLLLVRDVYTRLHLLAPASSVGVPLVVVGLAVETGAGRAAVKLLFIGALLALSSPVVTAATARAAARLDGRVPGEESPS